MFALIMIVMAFEYNITGIKLEGSGSIAKYRKRTMNACMNKITVIVVRLGISI